MPNISIVTAFYDIGRGSWTPERGFPHYLQRTREIYFERFSRLLKLKNDITIFTSEETYDDVKKICDENPNATTNIIVAEIFLDSDKSYKKIHEIQRSKEFQNKIHPSQKLNPEYWSAEYVRLTNLKAMFVDTAISFEIAKLPKNDMVAWIDFGYMRSDDKIPSSLEWNYNFDPEKIHLTSYKDYDGKPIDQIISENDVYILGATIVAHKKHWDYMSRLMRESQQELFERNMVDDDQGLELMCYLKDPDSFQLHRIPDHQLGFDPFVTFSQLNDTP